MSAVRMSAPSSATSCMMPPLCASPPAPEGVPPEELRLILRTTMPAATSPRPRAHACTMDGLLGVASPSLCLYFKHLPWAPNPSDRCRSCKREGGQLKRVDDLSITRKRTIRIVAKQK